MKLKYLLQENISRKVFWELVKFNYPPHQIAFTTEKSLKREQDIMKNKRLIINCFPKLPVHNVED